MDHLLPLFYLNCLSHSVPLDHFLLVCSLPLDSRHYTLLVFLPPLQPALFRYLSLKYFKSLRDLSLSFLSPFLYPCMIPSTFHSFRDHLVLRAFKYTLFFPAYFWVPRQIANNLSNASSWMSTLEMEDLSPKSAQSSVFLRGPQCPEHLLILAC